MRGRCRWSDPPIETRRFQVAPSLKINKKKLIVSPQTRLTSARIDRNRMKRIRKSNQRHYWVLPSSYRVFVDFTSYYEFFFRFWTRWRSLPSFYWVLQIITGFLIGLCCFGGYRPFSEFTKFYWVLHPITEFVFGDYRVLLSFADRDRVLSTFELGLPSFTGFYRLWPGFLLAFVVFWGCRPFSEFTEFYWVFPD